MKVREPDHHPAKVRGVFLLNYTPRVVVGSDAWTDKRAQVGSRLPRASRAGHLCGLSSRGATGAVLLHGRHVRVSQRVRHVLRTSNKWVDA